METETEIRPDRCLLEHQVFTMLGSATFRRSPTDGMPVMVVQLGDSEASLPLRALQREFAILDDTPDGRMLGLIAESLDYVCGLSLGDKLPSEVLDGSASWEPGPEHRALALAKLRLQLLSWIDPGAADARNGNPLQRLDSDPVLRQKVQNAFEQAASALGLADEAAVLTLVEQLANDLAYIEAMRDRLLRPVKSLAARVERMCQSHRGDHQRLETLSRVLRLLRVAMRRMQERFDEVAAQTGEVLAALRNIESQQAFIRSNRDQLYRSQRAWQPILAEWEAAEADHDSTTWGLLARTYQFLAPRFMPVTEWQSMNSSRQPRRARQMEHAMTW